VVYFDLVMHLKLVLTQIMVISEHNRFSIA